MLPKSMEVILSKDQKVVVDALRKHAVALLDHTPRFKYFTLHGSSHIQNLFKIVDILIQGGLHLSQDQAFLLTCAAVVHDVGMVVPLSQMDQSVLFGGKPQPAEPTNLELLIRTTHHTLVDKYVEQHFDFLLSLGLTASECALLRDISWHHRKEDLKSTQGHVQTIGALLRVMDELDISPSRAPISTLRHSFAEMDATSCWHWFKHNICEEWMVNHNVLFEPGGTPHIVFNIAVHPPREASIPYWLTQIRRPIHRVLFDEGAGGIVRDAWGVQLVVRPIQALSSAIDLGIEWLQIEQKALSAGRKVILVIDDEVRKMEDLFLPLMQDYHVIFSPNAKDALDKLSAAPVDLAIIDLQVGSGFTWSPEETQDYKMTGLRLCQEIRTRFPGIKLGILTASRYDLSEPAKIDRLAFLFRKPVDPEVFEREVSRVLA